MNEKEMDSPTRPTNRQYKNKAREEGLLVGWRTRAVVQGDASQTLGMAIYLDLDLDPEQICSYEHA
eukprot:jgi/Picsp_1/2089/NSC_05554-R1_---NA---